MHWLVWILEAFLVLGFLMAGFGKASGSEQQKQAFSGRYHYSLGMMYFIGAMEMLGALGLLVGYFVPILAVLAAAGLAIIMIGAVATHLRIHDTASHMLFPVVLAILSLVVLFGRISIGL